MENESERLTEGNVQSTSEEKNVKITNEYIDLEEQDYIISVLKSDNEEFGLSPFDLVQNTPQFDAPFAPAISSDIGAVGLYSLTIMNRSRWANYLKSYSIEGRGNLIPYQGIVSNILLPISQSKIEKDIVENISLMGENTNISANLCSLFVTAAEFTIQGGYSLYNASSDVTDRAYCVYTNCKIDLYLPYIGTVNLDPQVVFNSVSNNVAYYNLHIKYVVCTMTGDFTAQVGVYNAWKGNTYAYIYKYSGNMAIEIPQYGRDLKKEDFAQVRNGLAKTQNAINTSSSFVNNLLGVQSSMTDASEGLVRASKGSIQGAAQMTQGGIGAAQSLVRAGGALASGIVKRKELDLESNIITASASLPDYVDYGNLKGVSGWAGYQQPYLIVRRSRLADMFPIAHYYGLPLMQNRVIGSLTGYTKILNVYINNPQYPSANYEEPSANSPAVPTVNEVNLIKQTLTKGVYLTGFEYKDFKYWDKLYSTSRVDGYSRIAFLKLSSDPIDVPKNISYYSLTTGRLQHSFDFTTIKIIISTNEGNDYKYGSFFNYMCLTDIKRFYYITNIRWLGGSSFEVTGEIDVLHTFWDMIKEETAFIERNEKTFNPLIRDDKEIGQSNPIINIIEATDVSGFTKHTPTNVLTTLR